MLRDSGHLLRMVALWAVGLVVFQFVRHAIVPRSFGQYGHYRGAALAEIMARPVSFAGKQTCEMCHTDVAEVKNKGNHAGVSCEACHGPSVAHTEDPTGHAAMRPDPAILCLRCHEANPSKPHWFPQVISKEHAGDMSCAVCHQPHAPKI